MKDYNADSLRVAVLYGGVSSERDISIKSGKAVIEGLREAGHDVLPVDIVAEDISALVDLVPDVAFIALHGRFGEDGGVQAMLERQSIPYVGCDADSSRMAMDKMSSKCAFLSNDVPTPGFRMMVANESLPEGCGHSPIKTAQELCPSFHECINELGLPLIVKPIREGSSVGVSFAETVEDVAAALVVALTYDDHSLVEEYVPGREITVGILCQTPLPIVELRYTRRIFDFEAKYSDGGTQYIVDPENMTSREKRRAQEVALKAFSALGCRGFARVDMIIDRRGEPTVLEINTIPGFTSRSLFPMAAAASGIEFPALCDMLVRDALKAYKIEHIHAASA